MSRILAPFLLGLALFAAAAPAQERRIEELMLKSGLDKQLTQIETMVRMGIDEAQAQASARGLKTAMGPEEVARVKTAVAAAFGADVLRQACRETFAAGLTGEEERDVIAWLSSDLGKHITSLEESQDYTSAAGNALRDQAVKKLAGTLPASRVALLERLAAATLAGEAAAGMIINTTVGTTYGVAAANPPLDTTMVDALRRRMEAQRPEMAQYLHRLAVGEYAYTYRSLLNEELARYVAFAESAYGRRYHRAAVQAMDRAFARGSVQLGLELGTLEKREERTRS